MLSSLSLNDFYYNIRLKESKYFNSLRSIKFLVIFCRGPFCVAKQYERYDKLICLKTKFRNFPDKIYCMRYVNILTKHKPTSCTSLLRFILIETSLSGQLLCYSRYDMNYSDLNIDEHAYRDESNVINPRTVINLIFIRGITKTHPN